MSSVHADGEPPETEQAAPPAQVPTRGTGIIIIIIIQIVAAFAFGAFGGVSYGSLGIPLRVRSIAQAASGSHPSSLVQGVRAMFLRLRINLLPALLRCDVARARPED